MAQDLRAVLASMQRPNQPRTPDTLPPSDLPIGPRGWYQGPGDFPVPDAGTISRFLKSLPMPPPPGPPSPGMGDVPPAILDLMPPMGGQVNPATKVPQEALPESFRLEQMQQEMLARRKPPSSPFALPQSPKLPQPQAPTDRRMINRAERIDPRTYGEGQLI